MHHIRQLLTRLGVLAAHPAAFGIVVAYTIGWIAIQPKSFDWHGAATVIVWFMTLFIQRAEHRDTQAIHAKLDELLHVHKEASDRLTKLDEEEAEDIERHRAQARSGD
jgi:low affinity Fe/Cu permease